MGRYDFSKADLVVEKVLGKGLEVLNKPNIDNFDAALTSSFVNNQVSLENLQHLQAKHGNLNAAKSTHNNTNRLRFKRDCEEVTNLATHLSEIDNIEYKVSGLYHTPPNGYCGWHTNANAPKDRMYLVWCAEDNKSFFRYQDPYTNEVITKWEKKGWNVHHFIAPIWHCLASWTDRVSIGMKPLVDDSFKALKGIHSCRRDGTYGDWRINDTEIKEGIQLQTITHLLTEDKLETVPHSEICWKGMGVDPSHLRGERLENCDSAYPCIVIKDCINPKNLKYRMLDGKHRMYKMSAEGITKSKFYVLERNQIEEYIRPLDFIKSVYYDGHR